MRHPILLAAHVGVLLVTSLVAWSEESGCAPRSVRLADVGGYRKVSSSWEACPREVGGPDRQVTPVCSERDAVGLEWAARIRLVKYARRDETFDAMTPDQWVAVWRASAHCAREFAAHTHAWRGLGGGELRGRCADLWRLLEAETRRRLRAAGVPEGERMTRWIRLVLAAAG